MPVAKTAASFLHDFHASPYILDYSPSDIAICCLLLTFQIYGIQVPLTDDFDENGVWYRVSLSETSYTVLQLTFEKFVSQGVFQESDQGDGMANNWEDNGRLQ